MKKELVAFDQAAVLVLMSSQLLCSVLEKLIGHGTRGAGQRKIREDIFARFFSVVSTASAL